MSDQVPQNWSSATPQTGEAEMIEPDLVGERYQVLEVLGKGGMGMVLKARHANLNKFVAIKVLHTALLLNQENKQRFELEAQAGSRLSHPNLIAVFDYGFTKRKDPFLVMEYIEGESLESLLDRQMTLKRAEFLHIFIQSCKALQYIHNNGIIHRDLKTSNIMVHTIDGEQYVKLLDFGIAKVLTENGQTAQHLTATGSVFGSPPYMSPEQCTGRKTDIRSDIYSLGCVMYECLSGVPPFIGENALATIYMHVEDQPPPLAVGENPEYADLVAIVERCLQKKPADRFQNVGELLGALQRAAGGQSGAQAISASLQGFVPPNSSAYNKQSGMPSNPAAYNNPPGVPSNSGAYNYAPVSPYNQPAISAPPPLPVQEPSSAPAPVDTPQRMIPGASSTGGLHEKEAAARWRKAGDTNSPPGMAAVNSVSDTSTAAQQDFLRQGLRRRTEDGANPTGPDLPPHQQVLQSSQQPNTPLAYSNSSERDFQSQSSIMRAKETGLSGQSMQSSTGSWRSRSEIQPEQPSSFVKSKKAAKIGIAIGALVILIPCLALGSALFKGSTITPAQRQKLVAQAMDSGEANYKRGKSKWVDAQLQFEEALKNANSNDDVLIGKIKTRLGQINLNNGKFDTAYDQFSTAVDKLASSKDSCKDYYIEALLGYGTALSKRGSRVHAEEIFNEARSLADKWNAGPALRGDILSESARNIGGDNYAQAVVFYDQAVDTYKKLDRSQRPADKIAIDLVESAEMQAKLNNQEDAQQRAQRAMNVARRIDDISTRDGVVRRAKEFINGDTAGSTASTTVVPLPPDVAPLAAATQGQKNPYASPVSTPSATMAPVASSPASQPQTPPGTISQADYDNLQRQRMEAFQQAQSLARQAAVSNERIARELRALNGVNAPTSSPTVSHIRSAPAGSIYQNTHSIYQNGGSIYTNNNTGFPAHHTTRSINTHTMHNTSFPTHHAGGSINTGIHQTTGIPVYHAPHLWGMR